MENILRRLHVDYIPEDHEVVFNNTNENVLKDLLCRAIVNKENNTIMLVGNSGTGKTMTINRCLKALSLKHGSGSFKTISLNGNIQRGDTAALKEITRQLASHDTSRAYTTADEHMKFFYDTLKEQSAAGIPLILVLDFFEGFVRAQSKQTLLYNLFDLMQSGNHRLVVIGASRHLDVTDDLEKRIMSRFSSRQLLFENHTASEGVKVLQQRLLLQDNSPFDVSYVTEFNSKVKSLLDISSLSVDGDRGRDHLSTLQKMLVRLFSMGVNMKWLLHVGSAALMNVEMDHHPFLTESDIIGAIKAMSARKCDLNFLQGLSHTELSILIGFMMLEKKESEIMNFEMAYAEIEKFKSEFREEKAFHTSKATAVKSYEGLISQGLVNLIDPPADYLAKLTFVPAILAIDPLLIESGLREETINAPSSFTKWGERK